MGYVKQLIYMYIYQLYIITEKLSLDPAFVKLVRVARFIWWSVNEDRIEWRSLKELSATLCAARRQLNKPSQPPGDYWCELELT